MKGTRIECLYSVTGPLLHFTKLGCWKGSLAGLRKRFRTGYGVCKVTTYRCTDHKLQEKYLQGHLYQYYLAGELYSLACLTEFHQACHILCDDSTPDQYDIPASPMASGCIVACHPHQHQEQQQELQLHSLTGFVEAQCVLGDGGFIETRQLLDRYCAWAKVAVTMHVFRNVAKAVLEGKGAKSDRIQIAGKDIRGYTEVKWQVCQKEGEQPQQGEGQGNCHDQHQPHSDGMQHVPQDVQEYPQMRQLQTHSLTGFVEAQCVLGDGGFIETRQLLDRYCAWAKVAVTMNAFRNVAKAILEGKGAKSERRRIAGKDLWGYTEVKWQVCQKEGEQPQQGEGQGNCGEVNVICSGRKAQLDINTGHEVSCLVAWKHWEITTRLPLMLFVSNYISGASEDRATAGTDV